MQRTNHWRLVFTLKTNIISMKLLGNINANYLVQKFNVTMKAIRKRSFLKITVGLILNK